MYDDYATKKYEYEINKKDSRVVEVELMLQEQRETNRILKENHQELKENHQEVMDKLRITEIKLIDQTNSLDLANENIEELKESSILANTRLDNITTGLKSLDINGIKNLSIVAPLDIKKIEILVLIKVSFTNKEILYIVNRCQKSNYLQLRDRIISNYSYERKYVKESINVLYISESNNSVSLWNNLKLIYNKINFLCDGNKIFFDNPSYSVNNLIDELIVKSGEIRKPIDVLEKEYNLLLSS